MKKSFSFRRSWLDAINLISDSAVRAEITMIVVNYGLTGELVQSSNDMVNAIVSLIISRIPRRKESTENQSDGIPLQAESQADSNKGESGPSQSAATGPSGSVISDSSEPPAPRKRVICYRNPHYPDTLPSFAM